MRLDKILKNEIAPLENPTDDTENEDDFDEDIDVDIETYLKRQAMGEEGKTIEEIEP
jgi:hypothetical protein